MLLIRRKSSAVQSTLETYIREIDRTPLLTSDQEKDLAYRVEEGDSEAREHMVRANLRLVVSLARGYVGRGLALDDLIAEGNLGLLRAVEGFDPAMNTRFSTYASFWIKQSMKRAVVNSAKTIRLPSYMSELMIKWRRTTAQLQDELGRAPTEDEVAERLGLPKKKLKIIKKAIRVYNAAPQTDKHDSGNLLDESVMDHQARPPEEVIGDCEDLDQVLALIGQLDERAAAVLRMRFGLDGEEPKTLKEVGACLGLTRERVRQIELAALSALREALDAA
jgi:RNA polymerase primary sigma factor